MKFALCLTLASVATAMAVTLEEHQAFIKRQTNVQSSVDANTPAMTDANGNVVPFDTAGVYLDSAAKGL